jgi:FixJ family two-component response regulator
MTGETILLVDDEEIVITSLKRSLEDLDIGGVKTAVSGSEALDIIHATPNLAVIVSDFKMPGMNGVDLLALARNHIPDTTRILLTGVGDMEMAIDAVNRGHLFRFLVKPCMTDIFINSVKDGLRQYQLVISEHELLNKTLYGSVKVMVDILVALNPDVFTKSLRLRKLAREMSQALKIEDQIWEIELAALLCQVGAVTIPLNILYKWQNGMALDNNETEVIRSIPKMGAQLIKNIPRLENVAAAVGFQEFTYVDQITAQIPAGTRITDAAKVLRIILDFDRFFETKGKAFEAYKTMREREWEYEPTMLKIFEEKVLPIYRQSTLTVTVASPGEKKVNLNDLKIGMVLSRDVVDKNGILIVAKGTVITDVLRYKLVNFFRFQAIAEIVFIMSDF